MAKTIFNSSEKSNFILNLTEEKFTKMASAGLLTACFATSVFTMIPEIMREIDTSTSVSYGITAGGLAISGVFCMIVALISLIRKFFGKQNLFPVCAMGAIVAFAVISLIFSYDYNVGIYGFNKRGEGLLAIMYYFSFFVTALSIKREKALSTLVTGIICSGLLNSVWAVIQIFTGRLTYYSTKTIVYLGFKANPAAGLCQSPLFFGMMITLALTAAMTRAMLTKGKKTRIFCIICICLFSFTMLLTYTLIGIVGVAAGIVLGAAVVFIRKAPKVRLSILLTAIIPAVLAVVLVNAGVIGETNKYMLHDGHILWSADSFQRVGASGPNDSRVLDLEKTFSVYSHLNSKTMNIIKDYPLTGTGPEQLVYPQLYTMGPGMKTYNEVSDIIPNNTGTFDKVYNEYLYTAATRGIPSLIALIAVLLWVLKNGWKNFRKNGSDDSVCLWFITLAGVIIFFVGCSNITFSPVFWAAAGGACAVFSSDKAPAKKSEKSAKSAKK